MAKVYISAEYGGKDGKTRTLHVHDGSVGHNVVADSTDMSRLWTKVRKLEDRSLRADRK